jgi:hypothetical protein
MKWSYNLISNLKNSMEVKNRTLRSIHNPLIGVIAKKDTINVPHDRKVIILVKNI